MPYIKPTNKELLAAGMNPSNAGELNYTFTLIALKYLETQGKNYQHINDIIGALEGCKLELYRRVAAPYEDTKIQENGDVY